MSEICTMKYLKHSVHIVWFLFIFGKLVEGLHYVGEKNICYMYCYTTYNNNNSTYNYNNTDTVCKVCINNNWFVWRFFRWCCYTSCNMFTIIESSTNIHVKLRVLISWIPCLCSIQYQWDTLNFDTIWSEINTGLHVNIPEKTGLYVRVYHLYWFIIWACLERKSMVLFHQSSSNWSCAHAYHLRTNI